MLVSVAPTTGSWPHEAKLREEFAAEGEKTELNSAFGILLSSFFHVCRALAALASCLIKMLLQLFHRPCLN